MYLLKAGNQRFFLLPIELSETVGSLLLGHLTFLNPLVAFGSDISIKSCASRTWFSAQRLMVPPFVNALLIIKRLIVSTKTLCFIELLKLNWILFPTSMTHGMERRYLSSDSASVDLTVVHHTR